MEARKTCVEVEPSVEEAHVIIPVWHYTMGLKVRLFREDATFVQVYDWIGSLSTRPQYFRIMDHKGAVISPDNELYSGVFNIFLWDSLHARLNNHYMLLPTCCYRFCWHGRIGKTGTNVTKGNHCIWRFWKAAKPSINNWGIIAHSYIAEPRGG